MTTHRIGTARSLVLAAVALFGLGIGARHALAWANGGCVAAAYVTPGGVLSFYCANGTCPMPAGCFVTGAPSGPEGSRGVQLRVQLRQQLQLRQKGHVGHLGGSRRLDRCGLQRALPESPGLPPQDPVSQSQPTVRDDQRV
jgi:hypothetical protein